jgi:hypothetical protein
MRVLNECFAKQSISDAAIVHDMLDTVSCVILAIFLFLYGEPLRDFARTFN